MGCCQHRWQSRPLAAPAPALRRTVGRQWHEPGRAHRSVAGAGHVAAIAVRVLLATAVTAERTHRTPVRTTPASPRSPLRSSSRRNRHCRSSSAARRRPISSSITSSPKHPSNMTASSRLPGGPPAASGESVCPRSAPAIPKTAHSSRATLERPIASSGYPPGQPRRPDHVPHLSSAAETCDPVAFPVECRPKFRSRPRPITSVARREGRTTC
jgi:hypothetical protein